MIANLPEISYAYDISEISLPLENQRIIKIKRGVNGYFGTGMFGGSIEAKRLNDSIGVSPAQAEAMLQGSMFGWDVPAANPELYDENGKMKKTNKKIVQ